MKLIDIHTRLIAPFPTARVDWKPQTISKDRTRALMVAYVDARAVMDRLDACAPDDWGFEIAVVEGAKLPTVRGALTVCGVTRCDIGEADGSSEAGTLKAAASDALKRCAVHFGVGRYLYDLPRTWADWDDAKRAPVHAPELPDWARPEAERSPGLAHIAQAIAQLRAELPGDLDLQREVYRHLRGAIAAAHGAVYAPSGAPQPQEGGSSAPAGVSEGAAGREGYSGPTASEVGPTIGSSTIRTLQGHARRGGAATSEQRAALWAHLLTSPEPIATKSLTEAEGRLLIDTLSGYDDAALRVIVDRVTEVR